MRVRRRRFLKIAGQGVGSLVLVHCGADPNFDPDLDGLSEIGCPRVAIGALGDFVEGEVVAFDYPIPEVACFAVKLGEPAQGGVGPDGDIVAFNYLCTHMGCSLEGAYDHANKVLGPCRCHFTTFTVRQGGMVVLGQATQNLVQIELEVEGDSIVATGMTGVLYGELANRCCEDEEAAA